MSVTALSVPRVVANVAVPPVALRSAPAPSLSCKVIAAVLVPSAVSEALLAVIVDVAALGNTPVASSALVAALTPLAVVLAERLKRSGVAPLSV